MTRQMHKGYRIVLTIIAACVTGVLAVGATQTVRRLTAPDFSACTTFQDSDSVLFEVLTSPSAKNKTTAQTLSTLRPIPRRIHRAAEGATSSVAQPLMAAYRELNLLVTGVPKGTDYADVLSAYAVTRFQVQLACSAEGANIELHGSN
jgi:hypothetical protein